MAFVENVRQADRAGVHTKGRADIAGARSQDVKPLKRRIADGVNWPVRRYVVNLIERYVAKTGASQFHSLENARRLRAALESADYADARMQDAAICTNVGAVLDHGLRAVERQGLFLEFGVWSGRTVNYIADRHADTVHGFDSFEGLPEDWSMNYVKGDFATHGELPEVRSNVQLHVGWFDQTLPRFVAKNDDPVAFIHIDCDLYSSTKTVFQFLGDRIGPGTVIVFNEYFNYPGWQNHEFKAFQELVAGRKLRYRYLCYNENECHVATIID